VDRGDPRRDSRFDDVAGVSDPRHQIEFEGGPELGIEASPPRQMGAP